MTTARRIASATLALTAAVALSACQGQPDDAAGTSAPNTIAQSEARAAATTPPAETSAPRTNDTGAQLNEHGNIVKQLGEVGGIKDEATGDWTVQFAVETITVDWPCDTPHATPAENGHFVRVDLWASTSPEFSVRMQGAVFAVQFGWIDSAGITRPVTEVQTMATFMCSEAEPFNFWTMGDGQNYVGVVILDVPTPTGSLILTEATGGGWEWPVG